MSFNYQIVFYIDVLPCFIIFTETLLDLFSNEKCVKNSIYYYYSVVVVRDVVKERASCVRLWRTKPAIFRNE